MNDLAFYLPAASLMSAALYVAFGKKPVWTLLSLMLCFISTSIIWLGLGAEFFALALIFIYVGAVMALFLFVVFMLNVDRIKANATPFYYPLWLLLMVGLLGYIAYRILGAGSNTIEPVILSEQTKQLGILLYQKYALAFEVMGVALLTSMLGAIALVIKPRVAS